CHIRCDCPRLSIGCHRLCGCVLRPSRSPVRRERAAARQRLYIGEMKVAGVWTAPPAWKFRRGASAAGLLGLEAALAQLFEEQLDHVALDLDDAVLQSATAAAALLQRAGQLLQLGL